MGSGREEAGRTIREACVPHAAMAAYRLMLHTRSAMFILLLTFQPDVSVLLPLLCILTFSLTLPCSCHSFVPQVPPAAPPAVRQPVGRCVRCGGPRPRCEHKVWGNLPGGSLSSGHAPRPAPPHVHAGPTTRACLLGRPCSILTIRLPPGTCRHNRSRLHLPAALRRWIPSP